jgi:cytochrome oxidase assembly protein ShyY1
VAFLTSARGLRLLAFAVVMVVACVLLGLWQLERFELRADRNEAIRSALEATAAPLAEVVAPGTVVADVPGGSEWRTVVVTGRFDEGGEVVLRLRPVGGQAGVHVLTPLVQDDGSAVLVDRGFLAAGGPAEGLAPPAPPSGTVTVVGRLRLSEAGRGSGLDEQQVPPSIRFVDVQQLADQQSRDLAPVWVEAVEPVPGGTLLPVPPPVLSAGPSLIYAVQWFLFGLIALAGLVVLARKESRGPAADQPEAGRTPAR